MCVGLVPGLARPRVARVAADSPRLFSFFHDTATTEIYTLSLHDALPISRCDRSGSAPSPPHSPSGGMPARARRSEEHTSELQSLRHLVCRLLLEKKTAATAIWARSSSSATHHAVHYAVDRARCRVP